MSKFKSPKNLFAFFCSERAKKIATACAAFLIATGISNSVSALPSQYPLFLANPVVPIMMLNMSKDHQLFFKLYDDYTDLDGVANDGPETTYTHSYDYYGYFDSKKCYVYSKSNARFEPSRKADESTANLNYCNFGGTTGEWSGNFLNWASMTRIDAVRKILYGGFRSTDEANLTVLERAHLPTDAHSFAKFYDGNDIGKLTPFSAIPMLAANTNATGITICNTTPSTSGLSQSVTAAPQLRVVKGNYSLWASNERFQCRWRSEINDNSFGVNGNTADSRIKAYDNSPNGNTDKLGDAMTNNAGEFVARVKVCVQDLEEGNCDQYAVGSKKPIGLLQKFGETTRSGAAAKINFGLMTGSYGYSKAGGVLRKTVGNMDAEINSHRATGDGTFTGSSGAISVLNALRIYGYRYDNGTYHRDALGTDADGSDGCLWGSSSFGSGHCTNWGNPQAEIYLESLRYLLGKPANSAFEVDDAAKFSGLTKASWPSTGPVTATNYCAPLNILQFNTSSTSFDSDDLGLSTDVFASGQTLDGWTNKIASTSHENLSGSYFIGRNGVVEATATGEYELCTAKTISDFSKLLGTCPDAPRLAGSYQIAGLAYYARTNDLMPSTAIPGKQSVRTYGVAMSPSLPKATVTVPGGTRKINIIPACRNTSINPDANCAIVDFKYADQQFNLAIPAGTYGNNDPAELRALNGSTVNRGRLYVNWEDTEWGGDYDQDMWGIVDYYVSNTRVVIGTKAVAKSTPYLMGFGYVINGTDDDDGFYVHSGVSGYTGQDCNNCQTSDAMTYKSFTVGTSSATDLPPPLYYAAKWGGFDNEFEEAAAKAAATANETYNENYLAARIKNRDVTNSYYFATDPRLLEASLERAFKDISEQRGSASAVATNSTTLNETTSVYQAKFNSNDWSGTIDAYQFNANGTLPSLPTASTDTTMQIAASDRTLYTSRGEAPIRSFEFSALSPSQKGLLDSDAAKAEQRLNWLRGDATNEVTPTRPDGLRARGSTPNRKLLGDIVNSSPTFVGPTDYRYHKLPGAAGSSYRAYVERKKSFIPRIVVGANDGMVHVFNATTLAEMYAYVPNMVFPKLAALTNQNYGKASNPHQYLVDGPITVGDVYITVNGVAQWRTIVVGTLGAGGRGVYGLDITDDAPRLLFELTESNYPSLGYVMGRPIIAPLVNGRWAAIFGNGDGAGESRLFVIDIEGPLDARYSKTLSTGSGLGLSAPAVLPNALGQAKTVFAGDLSGQMWKFDLNNSSPASWQKSYRLFWAKDGGGNVQPITGAPTLGINSSKGGQIAVYFGTGKYYEEGDNFVSNLATAPHHSFYGITDIGREVQSSTLFQKTLSTTATARTVTGAPDWTQVNGWYVNFLKNTGERVTTKPILLADKLVFATLMPSATPCEFGGKSWLMEVPAVGDKYQNFQVLEESKLVDAIPGDLGFGLRPDGKGTILGSTTTEDLLLEKANTPPKADGRQSWRQLD